MRRVALLILGGLALLAIGGFAGWRLHRPAADARAYAEMRLIAVQVSLDEAPPDYVFWAGDSQVELQPGSQRPCGLDFLNGGISGSTAASYADHLARLTFKVPPRLAAADDRDQRHPREEQPAAGQADGAVRSRRRGDHQAAPDLDPARRGDGPPPVGRELGKLVDAGAVAVYSQRLRNLCGRLGCVFTDPFAALRDGDTGYAKPGALRDGLHLAAFRPALKAVEPALCGP